MEVRGNFVKDNERFNWSNFWFYFKFFIFYLIAGFIFAFMPGATLVIGPIIDFFVARKIIHYASNKKNWALIFLAIALLYHFIVLGKDTPTGFSL